MKNDVQWFASLCLDAGLVDAQQCQQIYDSLDDSDDLLSFGQSLLDGDLVEDVEAIQKLLDQACDHSDAGDEPPYIPLKQPGDPASPQTATATEKAGPDVPPPPQSQQAEPAPSPDSAYAAPRKPPESVLPTDGLDALVPDFENLHALPENQLRTNLIGLLKLCAEEGVSDLHLSAAARPFMRKDRENHYLSKSPLAPEASRRLNTILLNSQQIEFLDLEKDYDFAMPFSTGERFRVNLMFHKDGMAGTYRIVPTQIKSLEALGFANAAAIKKLLSYHNGLILVTGPVGSGKTATLASLVHEINQSREDHVISVEEPIEIVQASNKCSITQRGVGAHTNSFHSALKGALRQDPDIIVIGEMRDLETVEMAISASETGHLVMGTMHTSDAATTLNRLLDVFPPAQQAQIRAMVAESLRGIICQRLLPGKAGGLVLASELLLRNTAVSSLIREGKTQGLDNVMETGKRAGMVQMDGSVLELYRAGKITAAVARENIKNETIRVQVT